MDKNDQNPTYLVNEDQVMALFRNGDQDSFRKIYDKIVRPLTFYAENIIYSRNDAEDIVANAFYKLYHARERMKSYEHIRRWLYIIARNEAIDYIRLKSRQRESHTEVDYLRSDAETMKQLETERVKTAVLQSILTEIERLPRQRRTILRLYFFDQKSTGEIAEQLGLNAQTVLNHKAKALESLRKSGLKFKWLLEEVLVFLLAAAFYILKK